MNSFPEKLRNIRTFMLYKNTKYVLSRRRYAPKIHLTQITPDFGVIRLLTAMIECRAASE